LQPEAARLRNQLHALLMQCDPEYQDQLPPARSSRWVLALLDYQPPGPNSATQGVLLQERAAIVRQLAQRLRLASAQADDLARQIRAHTHAAGLAPLAEICGVGQLMAGTLAGILGPGCRFRTDAELAAYAGAAPLEASSAGKVRHRLSRNGNRRLNGLLHMIAVTQLRCWAPAQAYLARRISEGKTKREAMRALKRYLVRAIWQAWKRCAAAQQLRNASCAV
jgi:transposase